MPMSSRLPPPRRGVEQPLRGIEAGAEAELGVEHAHLADGPGGQPFPHLDHPRDEARPHRLHQEQLSRARRGDHLLGLAGVEGERLFAQHRLARLQGEQGVLAVERVRTGDVDDVDVGVGDELGVRAVAPRDPEAVSEGVGRVEGAGADRGDLGVRNHGHPLGELLRHPAGGEESPADFLGHGLCVFCVDWSMRPARVAPAPGSLCAEAAAKPGIARPISGLPPVTRRGGGHYTGRTMNSIRGCDLQSGKPRFRLPQLVDSTDVVGCSNSALYRPCSWLGRMEA